MLTAALFRTDIENEVEQNDDGTYSQYGKNVSKAMRYPWPGYHSRVAGDSAAIPSKKQPSKKRQRCCPRYGSSSLPYTPEHAFTLWSQYQATDDISVGAGARYIGSMHKGSDGGGECQRLPKVTGSPMPNWGIGLIAISTSS
ncbi:hypothetical protein ACLBR5_23040 [Escherichia coli]